MAEGNTIAPASKYEFDNLNDKFMYTSVGQYTTSNIKFSGNGMAIIFGRYGWDSNNISMSILLHMAENEAVVSNFGAQSLTVSCTGHTVTLTLPQTYAAFYVIANVPISRT